MGGCPKVGVVLWILLQSFGRWATGSWFWVEWFRHRRTTQSEVVNIHLAES
ncbi:hypothetical protein K227x_11780 [Rubripirellula lacrimiformis]|uniref:Uncharacterized protein n=1 Tax=Rubripirellula lacrimiformis TaxID=1930273 RepID=A0A517N6R0_9BACT|nr:hypothetical protein K227x_11780 [Rubripirellula lacrimiformis]